MADRVKVQELVHRYLSARVPLIVIRSIEPNRVMAILESCASALRSMSYYEHSRTEGLKDLLSGQVVLDETSLSVALDQARTTFQARTNANFVFSDVEDLDSESSTSRHFAEMVRLAESRQGSIILIVAKPVWSGLARLGISVALDLPTAEELAESLGAMVNDHRGVVDIQWQNDDLRQAAEILAGITEMEAVNVLATMLAKGKLAPEDLPELSEFKDSIFGDLSGLERIVLDADYQVGGLRNLRAWLAQAKVLMRADLAQTTLRPPRGVLLVGVPGCGKSLSAKAIAADWRAAALPARHGRDPRACTSASPSRSCARRSTPPTGSRRACCGSTRSRRRSPAASDDTGTSRRLIGQFLFWLQESTAKVFVVATANDVPSLPPELLRKGRFDEMFFVDLPDAKDREEIIRMYVTRYLEPSSRPTWPRSWWTSPTASPAPTSSRSCTTSRSRCTPPRPTCLRPTTWSARISRTWCRSATPTRRTSLRSGPGGGLAACRRVWSRTRAPPPRVAGALS